MHIGFMNLLSPEAAYMDAHIRHSFEEVDYVAYRLELTELLCAREIRYSLD
jgi:hypothetical protein